jgi:hypothetical protein
MIELRDRVDIHTCIYLYMYIVGDADVACVKKKDKDRVYMT